MSNPVVRYRHPAVFFGLATAIPWACWFVAGRLSHQSPQSADLVLAASLLGLAGLLAPLFIGLALSLGDRKILADIRSRLLPSLRGHGLDWALALGIMPASILLAMAISVAFGYSPQQFHLAQHASFTSGIFPVWFLLIAAPIIEELGWHAYGTDSLRSRFNLFSTCLIFALYWALWHAPLAGIQGYYQSRLVDQGLWVALNFPISIVPFVLIMNWLYYRSGRNIALTAVFHVTAGLFNELFQTHPHSKIIQTGLLLILAAIILWREREYFFSRDLSRLEDRRQSRLQD